MSDVNFLRNALDQSAIVAVTDTAGRIIHVNDQFCNISKYSRRELIGENHRLISSGYHSKAFFKSMWETISNGHIWKGEIKNRAKDGSYYWVHTSIVPYKNSEGVIEQYVSIRYEITPTKEAQESLRGLFDSTFEGLLIHTSEGKILDVNQTAGQLLSRNREVILETPFLELFSEPALSSITPQKHFLIHAVTLPDGRQRDFELASKPITYFSQPSWITAFRDVTERAELHAQILQQDRLASIGLLASSLAHEIGTPLGVIRGRAELLELQAGQNESIKKGAQVIMSQIDRVARLIRSLLTLARGDDTADLIPVNLARVVTEVTELLLPELNKKNIDLRLEVPAEIRVRAQNGPFHQVLLNLLVNSVHAIEDRHKREHKNDSVGVSRQKISITLTPAADSPGFVELKIKDTGCGISEKNLKQVFKPFFTTKDIGVGTGLGLATSLKIVNSWGGQIRVQSVDMQGAQFTLKLRQVD